MLEMNLQIRKFFQVDRSQEPHFQEVRFLHEEEALSWEDIERVGLPRSWFELSRISPENRVEFSREYWLSRLTYHPIATGRIENFFDQAHAVEWEEVLHSFHQEIDKGHGRIETREVRVVEDLDWLSNANKWKNLACLIEAGIRAGARTLNEK